MIRWLGYKNCNLIIHCISFTTNSEAITMKCIIGEDVHPTLKNGMSAILWWSSIKIEVSYSLRDSSTSLLVLITKRLTQLTTLVNYYHYEHKYFIETLSTSITLSSITKQLARSCTSPPWSPLTVTEIAAVSTTNPQLANLSCWCLTFLVNGPWKYLVTVTW